MATKRQNLKDVTIDMSKVIPTCQKIKQLSSELSEIFPERENLIEQLKFALLCRQHILMFGAKGTGKSDLLSTIFQSFVGSTTFSIEFTKFMNDSNIFGAPNVNTLKQEGKIEYDPNSNILTCNFAEFDEFFDANGPLQRSLLGVLNERRFKRGHQNLKANLHTGAASTNGDPTEEIRMDSSLEAVVDRFMFQTNVKYIEEQPNRLKMYQKFLGGSQPKTKINYNELEEVSSIVTGINQITQDELLVVYDDILNKYIDRTGQVISDRRKCQSLLLLEANSLMYGRQEAGLEDINVTKWAFCQGHDTNSLNIFNEICQEEVAEAQDKMKQDVDKLQLLVLEKANIDLPVITPTMDIAEIKEAAEKLKEIKATVKDVQPSLPSTQVKKNELEEKISELKSEMTSIFFG